LTPGKPTDIIGINMAVDDGNEKPRLSQRGSAPGERLLKAELRPTPETQADEACA